MANSYELKVVTPLGTAFEGEVRHALIPVENGYVGVLANHAPYVTSSAGGKFEIDGKDGEKKEFVVGPGFFNIAENQASFLTESFESDDNGQS